MEHYLNILPHVKTMIFDVDGVLTDGSVTLLPNGEQVRKMSSRDGFAIQLAVKKGYKIIVITGGSSQMVKQKLEQLGVKEVYLKSYNKIEVFEDVCVMHNLNPERVLYMGDDLPDYEVMKRVGVPCCPENAAWEIREISSYISPLKGGEGCVRDVIEKVLRSQQNWVNTNGDLEW